MTEQKRRHAIFKAIMIKKSILMLWSLPDNDLGSTIRVIEDHIKYLESRIKQYQEFGWIQNIELIRNMLVDLVASAKAEPSSLTYELIRCSREVSNLRYAHAA